MKKCNHCQETKTLESFTKDKRNKDGCAAQCQPCSNARNRAWIEANPAKNRAVKRASKKRCYTIEKRRREYEAPGYREAQRLRAQKWREENRALSRARSKQGKKYVIQRTPEWLSFSDKEYILGLYLRAQEVTNESGEQFHVDHIIPLRGKRVSGLHVPWNLRLLSAHQNQKKHATFG